MKRGQTAKSVRATRAQNYLTKSMLPRNFRKQQRVYCSSDLLETWIQDYLNPSHGSAREIHLFKIVESTVVDVDELWSRGVFAAISRFLWPVRRRYVSRFSGKFRIADYRSHANSDRQQGQRMSLRSRCRVSVDPRRRQSPTDRQGHIVKHHDVRAQSHERRPSVPAGRRRDGPDEGDGGRHAKLEEATPVPRESSTPAPVQAQALAGSNKARDNDKRKDGQTKSNQLVVVPVDDDDKANGPVNGPASADVAAVAKGKVLRNELWNECIAARKAMTSFRDDYRRMRLLHLRGEDPGGLPDWSADWSREEVDLRHLSQSMHLTSEVLEKEAALVKRMRWCTRFGAAPLDQQVSHLPHENAAHPPSWEEAWRDGAPSTEIWKWQKSMPAQIRPNKTRQASNTYPPDPAIVYPDDMDITVGPDIDPCDSLSDADLSVAGKIMAPGETIIFKAEERKPWPLHEQLANPVRWIPPEELRRRVDTDAADLLGSHMY